MTDMAEQLAAALNGHSITDDEGNITGESETSELESAPEDQTTDEETAPVETPPAAEEEVAKPQESEDEETLAEDDSGKKYVPESRFKKVYGKMKETERKLAELEAMRQQGESLLQRNQKPQSKTPVKVDKADILELKMTLPQFNPGSKEYSEDLDTLGAQILRANPGITPLEAGYRAIQTAQKLASKVNQTREEARTVKSQQSDQGITTRVTSRAGTQPDFKSMSDQEMERYMKQNGMW